MAIRERGLQFGQLFRYQSKMPHFTTRVEVVMLMQHLVPLRFDDPRLGSARQYEFVAGIDCPLQKRGLAGSKGKLQFMNDTFLKI